MPVNIRAPKLAVGDPRRAKQCEEALKYRFGRILSIAFEQVSNDARLAGWEDDEVRDAILHLISAIGEDGNVDRRFLFGAGRKLMTAEDRQQKEAARKAKNAEKMRIWREKNPPSPENKAKEAERARKWREANREKSRAHYKAWAARQRERN